jgi:hypothetical protein
MRKSERSVGAGLSPPQCHSFCTRRPASPKAPESRDADASRLRGPANLAKRLDCAGACSRFYLGLRTAKASGIGCGHPRSGAPSILYDEVDKGLELAQ